MANQLTHWADQTAMRVLHARPGRDTYVLASGITPSGRVHVGNFREVITVDLVARALKGFNKNVKFIYSWDNFDTFRKVPRNLPDPAAFDTYLHQPIARIPDPWGEAENYARGRINLFEAELRQVGIQPEYRYQHDEYGTGRYAEEIRKALLAKDTIAAILNKHRQEALDPHWLPTSVYCESCDRDDQVEQEFDGDWTIVYRCDHCGGGGKLDLRSTKQVKLGWRTDWPMRWFAEQVDFEPGGKDHSSRGGSFDTGKDIADQVWSFPAPIYLQYDFVAIKGGTGKMSSSSGELYSLSDVLEVYEPQIVRWIFASQRPNHDFALAFDEDVIKVYDEFDRAEAQAFAEGEVEGKQQFIRRSYELSTVEGRMYAEKPFRPAFRELCNRLQICNGNIQRVLESYYANEVRSDTDRRLFERRSLNAWNWLTLHAPSEFRYSLREERKQAEVEGQELAALTAFRQMVTEVDLVGVDPKGLNDAIYSDVIHKSGVEPKRFFELVYDLLISRPQGPRLPGFMKEIGKKKLLELL